METIWRGDVKQFSRAYDLICIIDQIHDYAVNNHREFVMKHLEAWHVRHEKTQQPSGSPAPTLHAGKSTDGTSNPSESSGADGTDAEKGNKPRDFEDELDYLMDFDTKMPEWFLLKQTSKWARQAKAQETRERNRRLRGFSPLDTDDDSPIQKQGQNYPPKAKAKATKKAAPKARGRGRPQKKRGKVLKPAKSTLRVTRSAARKNISAS